MPSPYTNPSARARFERRVSTQSEPPTYYGQTGSDSGPEAWLSEGRRISTENSLVVTQFLSHLPTESYEVTEALAIWAAVQNRMNPWPWCGARDSLPAESYFSLQVALQMGLSRNQGFSITFQAADHQCAFQG